MNTISKFFRWLGSFFGPAEQEPFRNKFVAEQSDPYKLSTEDKSAVKKGFFHREDALEKLLREIVATEESRVAKLRNRAIIDAEIVHQAALRDNLVRHYIRLQAIDIGMTRLKNVLRDGNDATHVLTELNSIGETTQDLEEFLKNNTSEAIQAQKNQQQLSGTIQHRNHASFDPAAR